MAAENQRKRKLALAGLHTALRIIFDADCDSSSSDEEAKIVKLIAPILRKRRGRNVPRLQNYVEEVIPAWSQFDLKSHFRLTRETFKFVLGLIGNNLNRSHPGLPMISPEKQFLLTIWRMATLDSYRSIYEKFDVSRSTALLTVRRVTKALTALAPCVIQWPTLDVAKGIWRGFEEISAFPKAIGAIDGTHIHIPAPKKNAEAHVNRKKYHSIQLQGVCDHKGRFIHCFVGHAGSVHDQRVFRLSPVYEFLGNDDKFPEQCHLLGGSAYKLHENLMVPFSDNGHLTEREKNFNFCLSSARVAIERAFGLLKDRYRSLLHCLPMNDTASLPDFVLACCVLHNVCIWHGDELENLDVPDSSSRSHSENAVGRRGNDNSAAIAKRYDICGRLILRNV